MDISSVLKNVHLNKGQTDEQALQQLKSGQSRIKSLQIVDNSLVVQLDAGRVTFSGTRPKLQEAKTTLDAERGRQMEQFLNSVETTVEMDVCAMIVALHKSMNKMRQSLRQSQLDETMNKFQKDLQAVGDERTAAYFQLGASVVSAGVEIGMSSVSIASSAVSLAKEAKAGVKAGAFNKLNEELTAGNAKVVNNKAKLEKVRGRLREADGKHINLHHKIQDETAKTLQTTDKNRKLARLQKQKQKALDQINAIKQEKIDILTDSETHKAQWPDKKLSLQAKMAEAKTKMDQAISHARQSQYASDALNQLARCGNSFGQIAGSGLTFAANMAHADAKQHQAEADLTAAFRDQTKELAQDFKETVKEMRKFVADVAQAQNAAMANATRV